MLPVDYQLMMETKYSKANIRNYVRQDISGCADLMAKINICVVSIVRWINEDHYESKKTSLKVFLEVDIEEMIIDIMALMLTAYPLNVQFDLTAAVGLVNKCLPQKSDSERIKRCGEILFHMASNDLVNMRPAFASAKGVITISNKYSIGGETAKYITLSRFTPPMVCEPNEIKRCKDSAYLTKQQFSALKGKHQHDGEINLVSLNKFIQTPFSLDIETLMMIEDYIKPKKKKKYDTNAVVANTTQKEKAFESLTLTTAEVCSDLVKAGNRFYFDGFYCGRGRTYCRGHHVNMHGNSFRKSMLNFADPVQVDPSSVEEYRDFFEITLDEPIELKLTQSGIELNQYEQIDLTI